MRLFIILRMCGVMMLVLLMLKLSILSLYLILTRMIQ